MNILILKMLETKLFAGSSQVPLLIPVPLHYSIHRCYQNETPDVEFTFVVEKGSLEIFLDY